MTSAVHSTFAASSSAHLLTTALRCPQPATMVGNTPVLWIGEPFAGTGRGFWAKLEGSNPGGMKRTARYPSTSSNPERCGGTSTAATSNDPIITTAATSPIAVAAGRPYRVSTPGSGNPSNRRTSLLDTAATAAATRAAPTVQPTITPTTALLVPATENLTSSVVGPFPPAEPAGARIAAEIL